MRDDNIATNVPSAKTHKRLLPENSVLLIVTSDFPAPAFTNLAAPSAQQVRSHLVSHTASSAKYCMSDINDRSIGADVT